MKHFSNIYSAMFAEAKGRRLNWRGLLAVIFGLLLLADYTGWWNP